jgi:hypothetical protein
MWLWWTYWSITLYVISNYIESFFPSVWRPSTWLQYAFTWSYSLHMLALVATNVSWHH